MDDERPSERRTPYGPETVSNRSRKDLKAALMRKAFDGESRYNPAEMILLIQWRLSASQPDPAHADILADINLYGFESPPRSILMLDAMARQIETEAIARGEERPLRTRYEYTPAQHDAPALIQ